MPSPAGATPSSRGFTLIEVLIAVVILATGIVVVLQGMHTALAALDGAVDKSRASMLVRSKVVEAQAAALDGEDLSSLGTSGRFPDPYDMYRWRLDVSSGSPSGSAVNTPDAGELYDVGVAVWQDGSERLHEVSTLVFVPPDTDDGPGEGLE